MEKLDYKKEYRDLYQPKKLPTIIDVPEMTFITVEGKGDPNTSAEYAEAIEILYGLSFTIKMSKMSGDQPEGYFEYVVPPLEGLWYADGISFNGMNVTDKNKLRWISMIRQPEFVTEKVFENAKISLSEKKPGLDLSKARLTKFTEGLCVQIMHTGPYDNESESIAKMKKFIAGIGFTEDLSAERLHHEIYLSDPRRCKPERLRTVIRCPIKQGGRVNVYESIPILRSENFTLRPISHDDTEDLLKVYSDEKAVPFFNSDNCHGDDFHYTTIERMKEAMDFWDLSYKNKYFVRWAAADRNNTAVGTVELFKRISENGEYSNIVLRLDLRSDHEKAEIIGELLKIIAAHAYDLFECDSIVTKAVPAAGERIKALEETGFAPFMGKMQDYFERKKI